ncbi:MAG: DUF1615 family protein [Deltaproteobacteria bacterium]|nr:DUF1615 family protein [Deltaproteobacteria bacterium]
MFTLALGCRSKGGTAKVEPKAKARGRLGVSDIEALIPPHVAHRAVWANAVANGLRSNKLPTDAPYVCGVIAIIAQESNFAADPVVPGLGKLVEARLDAYRSKLGLLGKPVFNRLLAGHSPTDERTFEKRMESARTERDVDVTFRDLVAFYQSSYPTTFKALSLAGQVFDIASLDDMNPITTAGPMQVNVKFAEQWAREHKGDPDAVRDALYTPVGGVYYGTARLFGYDASYAGPLHRFADYNAGVYASRNAALQAQVMRLTGGKLALDGDFLAYDKDAEVKADDDTASLKEVLIFRDRYAAEEITERRVRKDLLKEKTRDFEKTETYQAIKKAYAAKFKSQPRYAIMPEVAISSPKLRSKRSTNWYAQSVQRRFESCMAAATPSE